MVKSKALYDSGVNILGGIPNYCLMLDYISDTYGVTSNSAGAFEFRTEKSLKRFIAGIESCILQFRNNEHKKLFFEAIANKEFSASERLILLFWQLTYSNKLFSKISKEVFMKNLYCGRLSISTEEVLSFMRELKVSEPNELQWSEGTLKTSASKYLTILKKLGLAEGSVQKKIIHSVISSRLFVYFIRFSQLAEPENKTLSNSYMCFSFLEEQTIINRLKKIENIQYWDIAQVGNDIRIELK